MIRWFIEDLKVYRELNEIRVDYENLLQKYYDQIINANTKIEEIEIKKAKIESEGSDIREIMERIEESLKKKERAPIIKEIEEEFDEKLRI
jgi:proteasome assembly chaperone (PAC2) family protein